ncbi:hemerythrin domain-containing protein [Yoonia sp. R2331]|uniref:hemerythrin domain-containing protein n=1 Tax=Yoonia sp. R2331 TaxID=3237238 RepID=UPI0034E4C3CC
MSEALNLENRAGLPDPLRVLLAAYPRDGWTTDPGFDALIRFWLDRHLMFRRLLADMTKTAEALIDETMEAPRFGAVMSRYGGHFVNGLHEHHTIEDTHYFPVLSQKDARITKGFAILDADHHAIDRHLSDFVDLANGALQKLDNRDPLRGAVGDLHDHLGLLHRLLDRHLTDEEELVVPVILKYGAQI